MARSWKKQGKQLLDHGLSTGTLSPERVIFQEIPGLGGVKIGEKKQLQGLAVLFQDHRVQSVGELRGKVHPVPAESGFEQGHTVGTVMVPGNDAHLGSQIHQGAENRVKQPDSLGGSDLPVVHVPGQDHAGRAFPFHLRKEYPFQKPPLIFQQTAAIEHPSQMPVRGVQQLHIWSPLSELIQKYRLFFFREIR